MKEPARIEISWERARELLANKGISMYGINCENALNDFMGNGRTSFSTNIFCLTSDEYSKLKESGYEFAYEGDIALIVQKETHPGKYMVGEF